MFGVEWLGVEDIWKESIGFPEAPLEQDYSTYQRWKAGREDTGNLGPHININIGGQISLMVSKDMTSQAAAGEKVIQLDQ